MDAVTWAGETPVYLIVVPSGKEPVLIDLDAPEWRTTHAETLASQATWHLMHKVTGLVFTLIAWEHEKAYYVARHIGRGLTSEYRAELVAYGIGKERADGHFDRLWLLPNGQICAGDDVEQLAISILVTQLREMSEAESPPN